MSAVRVRPSWSLPRPQLVVPLLVVILVGGWPALGSGGHPPPAGGGALAPTPGRIAAGDPPGGLSLSIARSFPGICLNGTSSCAAGTGSTEVTLTAVANESTWRAWPAVSIVFVLETTPYDGVYDPTTLDPGNDSCGNADPGVSTLCEESNGVPFFAANAGTIASDIAMAHPGTRFTFGLVAYFATFDKWDDGQGFEYNVEVGEPVPAQSFGAAVKASFINGTLGGGEDLSGSDLSENFLHSSSITALYGVLAGAGIDWRNDTHHVIVWVGSTAPRDPSYPVNYCPSPATSVPGNVSCTVDDAANFTAPTCEPSYTFGYSGIVSPVCEGWVSGPNGSSQDSIANLAHSAPECVGSLGGECTIDTIDLYDGVTDPSSGAWPARDGSGPFISDDVESILAAGCDLAVAAGGTWDGPTLASCPGTGPGTLEYVGHGPYNEPDVSNPTLLAAMTGVGLGSPTTNISAFGGNSPMFTFVSWGNIEVEPGSIPTAACDSPLGEVATCQTEPTIRTSGSREVLQWNWSLDPNSNDLTAGDLWTAEVTIIAVGPPVNVPVPVDACTTAACLANGSSSVGGLFTSADSALPGALNSANESFPLVQVTVVTSSAGPPQSSTPPTPPGGPPPPPVPVSIPGPVPLPVVQPILAAPLGSIGGLSIQAVAVGLLAAGFSRIAVGRRKVAIGVAVRSGINRSAFDTGDHAETERFVRQE